MAHVHLVQLSKQYGEVAAVERLDLEIASGEMVALLGPSGCGKTTTMRIVAGLLDPTGGDVRFDGRSVLSVPAERRGAVMVFQKHLLFPHMSVLQNVAFGLRMAGIGRKERESRAEEMLARVQLDGFGSRRAHELSGGQQQRVALARALVVAPKVLLLDEPLSNLDANLRLEMRRLIRSLQQELGITTCFVTHDQEEAVMLADRVALMMAGRLLQYDTPRALYARPSSAVVGRFFRNENLLPGTKRGALVDTAAGPIAVPEAAHLPDGSVLVTVRPEHVQLSTSLVENCLPARVRATTYMGSHTWVEVEIDGRNWSAVAPADTDLTVGSQVCLHLPARSCWVVPAENPEKE